MKLSAWVNKLVLQSKQTLQKSNLQKETVPKNFYLKIGTWFKICLAAQLDRLRTRSPFFQYVPQTENIFRK